MHRSSNGDEPLNVQVAGRTLVIQGSKRALHARSLDLLIVKLLGCLCSKAPFSKQGTGNMMTSFQRSFPLPWEPDPEHVAVTYGAPFLKIQLSHVEL